MELNIFTNKNLYEATVELFSQLNIELNSNTAQNIDAKAVLGDKYKDREPFTNITEIYFAGLVEDSLFDSNRVGATKYTEQEAWKTAHKNYNGLMLFALKLNKKPTRTEISGLTRAFNCKSLAMPVGLLFQYEHFISLALPERFLYKQSWRQGEKVSKTIILRDINCIDTHRGHIDILKKLSEHKAHSFSELNESWKKTLDIKTLNDEFYYRLAGKYNKNGDLILAGWYQKAFADLKIDLKKASQILGKDIENELRPQAVIRIIVRMMFIWFMKQKGLINPVFFDKNFAKEFLKGENKYYNAVLQNLFFAVLNRKIDERRFRKYNPKNKYDADTNDYGVFDVFRYQYFFKDGKTNEFLNRTKEIPFVNGGLFQCHDYKFKGGGTGTGNYAGENDDKNYIIDGFSDNPKERAKISDNVMFSLIDLFESYVWTIEESTPEEQDIALDPELLGTVFENIIGTYNPESQANARKASGSFYTPKSIVDYMCRESFRETLKTRFPNLSAEIDGLLDNNEDKLDFPNTNNLLAAITSLKILDPACGSGAFPMGICNLMVRTIEKLQEHKTTYKNKLDIIQNCIYGVDIQNIAIEISKLRFFISLLVDYETPENIAKFDVLPNLETKFAVANTLIGIDLKKDERSLFDFNEEFRALTNIFTLFTTAKTTEEKNKIKNAFENKKREIINNAHSQLAPLTKEKIAKWNPFNVYYCSPFFDRNVMFGIQGGFDIVIGNPPYVSAPSMVANNPKFRQDIINTNNYTTLYQKWDLYIPFIEFGLQMLKPNGIFTMIVPYPLTSQTYGERLRKLIVEKYNMFEIVDLNGTKIFDNATVSNCIPFISKNENKRKCCFVSNINEQQQITHSFCQSFSDLVQDKDTAVWNLTTEKRKTNRHADMNVLGDFCYISKGMVLNADEKTAKGEFSKEDLISETKDKIHCRKYIEAKDIEKYRVKKNRYIEYNTERSPNKLSRPTFRELYEQPKLMTNCLGNLKVTIDKKQELFCEQSLRCAVLWKNLVGIHNKSILASIKRYSRHSRKEMELYSEQIDLCYLLGILNSKYASVLLSNIRGGDYHIVPEHLRNIPIPTITASNSKLAEQIKSKVEAVLQSKQTNPQKPTVETEKEIDCLVYVLYNLEYEEVKIIDPDFAINKAAYEQIKQK